MGTKRHQHMSESTSIYRDAAVHKQTEVLKQLNQFSWVWRGEHFHLLFCFLLSLFFLDVLWPRCRLISPLTDMSLCSLLIFCYFLLDALWWNTTEFYWKRKIFLFFNKGWSSHLCRNLGQQQTTKTKTKFGASFPKQVNHPSLLKNLQIKINILFVVAVKKHTFFKTHMFSLKKKKKYGVRSKRQERRGAKMKTSHPITQYKWAFGAAVILIVLQLNPPSHLTIILLRSASEIHTHTHSNTHIRREGQKCFVPPTHLESIKGFVCMRVGGVGGGGL